VLHITNGDSAAAVMRQAGIAGEILPWRDVLHEGPVPEGLSLQDLSAVRAQFIADSGWASPDEVSRGFGERDATLASFRDHAEVILWFEHDLYDQLQLLQLLDWFSAQDFGTTTLSLICIDEYLGTLTPDRMAALPAQKVAVGSRHLELATRAWSAFRSPDPAGWAALLDEDTSALPFLAGAVTRHLEQYPSVANGLSRTETQILASVRSGIRAPGRIFEASQKAEERIFMGDTTFWSYMDAMFRSPRPLLATATGRPFVFPRTGRPGADFLAQQVELTETGGKMLLGELDWIELNGIDKWLGGVRLEAASHWRWDVSMRKLSFRNRQSN
jgi:hypothetical protein